MKRLLYRLRRPTLAPGLYRLHGGRVWNGMPFWYCSVSWDTYPFRIVWIGFWQLSYDRSGRWYERWPHMSINWNND